MTRPHPRRQDERAECPDLLLNVGLGAVLGVVISLFLLGVI